MLSLPFVLAHGGRQRFASSIAVDAVHRIGPRIASLRYPVIASLEHRTTEQHIVYILTERRSETHCCRVILNIVPPNSTSSISSPSAAAKLTVAGLSCHRFNIRPSSPYCADPWPQDGTDTTSLQVVAGWFFAFSKALRSDRHTVQQHSVLQTSSNAT